jgi:competence CoiA-like predicted nuclease
MISLGLVIEFQYSRLALEERIARESFHRNMVWVVEHLMGEFVVPDI